MLLRDDDPGDDWQRAPLTEFESHLHDDEKRIISDQLVRREAAQCRRTIASP